LAPGPLPGTAIKADGSAPVIGIALEGLAEGRGKVLTLVHRGSMVPTRQIEAARREMATALDQRTPDPETGSQEMSGNYQVVLDAGADETSRFSIFRDGDKETIGAEVMRVDEQGNLYLKGALRPASMDLAEYFPVNEPVEPGDVLAVDLENPGFFRRAAATGDPAVIGVVSADPGVLLGGGVERTAAADPELALQLEEARRFGDTGEEAEIWRELESMFQRVHAAVALSGTVLVKVDAGYGAIRPGDLLMSSPTPGHAARAPDPAPGTILGKALEALDAGTGRIRMLVMLR